MLFGVKFGVRIGGFYASFSMMPQNEIEMLSKPIRSLGTGYGVVKWKNK